MLVFLVPTSLAFSTFLFHSFSFGGIGKGLLYGSHSIIPAFFDPWGKIHVLLYYDIVASIHERVATGSYFLCMGGRFWSEVDGLRVTLNVRMEYPAQDLGLPTLYCFLELAFTVSRLTVRRGNECVLLTVLFKDN